jgi:NAD(P)-dependent dehydrogenase (short-subunit alcohol dehydrogenase family)
VTASPTAAWPEGSGLLRGEVVLVTGAAGEGVGRGVCDALDAAGASLVLVDIEERALEEARRRYPGSIGIVGDVSDADAVARILEEAAAHHGALTGLVNSAGIGLNRLAHEASSTEFDRLFAVDVRGQWLMAAGFSRRLIEAGRPGAIVNISSVHARSTMSGYAIYAAAKAACEGLTRGLAVELGAHAIRCNAVAPGYVHADQNITLLSAIVEDPEAWVRRHTEVEQPLTSEIAPIDVGAAVAFLLSPASGSITGQTLAVDAGLQARLYSRATFDRDTGGAR